MGKGGKQETKPADKSGKGGTGKGKADAEETKGKGAQSINVRHILVSTLFSMWTGQG
jgi:hypothetical protein